MVDVRCTSDRFGDDVEIHRQTYRARCIGTHLHRIAEIVLRVTELVIISFSSFKYIWETAEVHINAFGPAPIEDSDMKAARLELVGKKRIPSCHYSAWR